MQYELKPLNPIFSVEIRGVDLLNPLSQEDVKQFYELLSQHKLLVFRQQNLSPEAQIAACRQLGEIVLHPAKSVPWQYRELTYVANTDMNRQLVLEHCGPSFELWHSDTCYLPQPARMSLLYAETVPAAAGETLFADMVRAYEDLPEDIKHRLADKKAVFGSGYQLMQRCQRRGYALQIPENEIEDDVIHPVFRTHPDTGCKSIYVNWAHTDRIVDMPEEESENLLNYLYEHARSDKYVYAHFPEKGDLMVWDNAALIHSNTEKKLTDIRVMRRVMIQGSIPF